MQRHAATAVVLLLLIGTAVAFAETERLKLKPTPIEESYVQPAFSPVCRCATARAEIRLRLHRADDVTLRMIDARTDETVAVMRRELPRGRSVLYWDGKDESGGQAHDGRYLVDVDLQRADRTFRLPQSIMLDTVPPQIRMTSFTDGVRPGQLARVYYRASEQAHAQLYVNGKKRVGPTHTKLRSAKLQWRPKRSGVFDLQLAAVDLAGNLGPRTEVFELRVRSLG